MKYLVMEKMKLPSTLILFVVYKCKWCFDESGFCCWYWRAHRHLFKQCVYLFVMVLEDRSPDPLEIVLCLISLLVLVSDSQCYLLYYK